MRYILMLTATLFLLTPAISAPTTSQDSVVASAQGGTVDLSAAKKGKAKGKSAGKVQYMRAVPSK
jgi:hypothetical protein